MTALTDLPIELLLDNLLMNMPIETLLKLACSNKVGVPALIPSQLLIRHHQFFANLCADELLWSRRLKSDYNFSGTGTARTSGWKFIYRNLYNPKVFVWGETANGRLGLPKIADTQMHGGGVPFPMQLRIPGARIVNIVAGGMSFHAVDTEGRLWVWGTLNGNMGALSSEGFSEAGKAAYAPLRLDLPSRITEISCGRLHACALDHKSQVWNFTNWGRPFVLSSSHIQRDSRPVQVECGWAFSSLLTKSGEIFVWWPLHGTMADRIVSKNDEMDAAKTFAAKPEDGVIPCATWTLEAQDLNRLPPLPPLPKLVDTGDAEGENEGEPKIIKIAAMDGSLVALTNQGHVVLFRGLESEDSLAQGRWKYLPKFSEIAQVREVAPFASGEDGSIPTIAAPQTMKITHISAHFLKFFAYSTGASSVVLMGSTNTTEDTDPHIEPALQNNSVISVLVGDWHNAALTATGKLLTWGGYSSGALGLGNPSDLPVGAPGAFPTEQARDQGRARGFGTPPETRVPTQVRFDHARKTPKERFCILACASGWQTGALVIDLQKDDGDADESDEDDGNEARDANTEQPPTHFGLARSHWRGRLIPGRARGAPIHHQPHHPFPGPAGGGGGFGPGGGIFRIGFAGRGMARGRGGGGRGQVPPDV
ncbi:RCC1/BLIP-II protein [Mycena kentingensis (nom. inval.)]|nr:RCC1/BLIP-II protein [Mycena kentingensis (nom. inval.)]